MKRILTTLLLLTAFTATSASAAYYIPEPKLTTMEAKISLYDKNDGDKNGDNDEDFTPNDLFYESFQWNMRQINMPKVWKKGYFGEGAVIGIIDSGLYMENDDLDYSRVIGRYNAIDDSNDVTDNAGHGTFITGILNAVINNENRIAGIADKADIVVIKAFEMVYDDEGNAIGYAASEEYLSKALDIALESNLDVLNMSMGVDTDSEKIREKINRVVENGTIVVASVGNYGENPELYNKLMYPAAYDNVIGVGGVTSSKKRCLFSQVNDSVFVVAPGGTEHMHDRQGDYVPGLYNSKVDGDIVALNNGTSFAAPHVSGVAAIAKGIYPELTPEQFMDILKDTSEDLGAREEYGYGLLDADKVVSEVEKLAEEAARPTASPAVSSTPTPTPTPEFTFNPQNYRGLTYDKESKKALIETDDREAVVYAAEFDGLMLKSLKMVKISDLPASADGKYEINLEAEPTKLFLWHNMTGCIKAWEDDVVSTDKPVIEPTITPTAEPTVKPTLEPTTMPTAGPEATPYIDEEYGQALVDLINAARTEAKVHELNVDSIGVKVSRDMVWDMLEKDYKMDEYGEDIYGYHPSDYISERSGEIVSVLPIYVECPYDTEPEVIMEAIAHSDNFAKVLSEEFTQIGVGIARDKKTDKDRCMVNLFFYITE